MATALVTFWLTDHARAEEISFDQALALGEQAPAVSGPRDMLEARESGDQKMGGTAGATHLIFMPGALFIEGKNEGFEMQATITQGWNLRDLGGARRDAARSERGVLGASVRAAALRSRLEAARRWIDLATLSEIAEVMESRVRGLEKLVESRERALSAGVGTAVPLAEARALLAELRQSRLDLEGDEFSAATQLSLSLGRAPGPEPLRTAGPMPEPSLPEEPEIRDRITNVDAAPDLVVERLRETAAHARAVEASAQYAPVLTLGAQGEHSALGPWVIFGVTGVTFDGFGQRHRWSSFAEGEAAGASAETTSARLRVHAELEEAVHELRHSAEVVRVLEEQTLPALRALVASLERAVALGEATRFALIAARDRELAAVGSAYRAHGAVTWAKVHLWLLLAELAVGDGMP
jgi:cobalt-zinc-cadmium efflux system outer membrane protein